MKKKFITGGIVVAFLCLIGYTGTRYANEIILWGGETDIDTINENLTQLDHTLTDKEQAITDLTARLAQKEQTLQDSKADVQEYQTKVNELENQKKSIGSRKTKLRKSISQQGCTTTKQTK